MSTPQELLATLQAQAIDLWVDGDRLRYRAPKGALTPELRNEMAEHKAALLEMLRRADERRPVSFAQQRLWFLQQLDKNATPYNEQSGLRISGALDVDALCRAINEIVRRHAILRTTFSFADGAVWQTSTQPAAVAMPISDLADVAADEQDTTMRRIAHDEATTPFDLANGPLLRTRLVRLAPDEHVLLLTVHHIVADGWSAGIFLRELTALYAAYAAGDPSPLPALPMQYADFAARQRSWLSDEVVESQLRYWREQLSGAPTTLTLPTDRVRPPMQSYRGATVRFAVGPSLTARLKALSRQLDATLFMTLFAGFVALLTRYGDTDDIVVGSPIANRNRAEIEDLIGFFVNTLVLRVRHGGNPTFAELVEIVRNVTVAAYENQDLPFEKLVDELQPERSLGSTPLFQVMFALQSVPMQALSVAGMTFAPMMLDNGASKFDLTLHLFDGDDQLRGVIEYSTDLFDAATMERLAGHYVTLLEGVANEGAGQPIRTLPLLTAAEWKQIVVDWNDTAHDFADSRPIHRIFAAQAAATPDRIALTCAGESLTYAQLNARTNQLAHRLIELGVGPDVLVGVCAERSVEMVVALYAILKAGGAYVPIDPSYPPARVAFMLEDAAVPVLLTQSHLADGLPATTAHVILLDTDRAAIAGRPSSDPDVAVADHHLAYMIYTSGSTGRPKGAMNTHGAIRNRLLWMQAAYDLRHDDAIVQKTPFSFDVSVWEFFWPLIAGARLVVARPGGHQDASYLVDLIQTEQITTMHFVPSMLQAFLQADGVADCRSLRRVICSGEALPYELVQRFFECLDAELHNLYGPTEAAVDVTWYPCRRDDPRGAIPIGWPIANTQIYVLDRAMQPVPIGVPGEIHIGGVQLARGYHNRPELTASKFVACPAELAGSAMTAPARLYKTGDLGRYLPDGAVQYLGRLDFQVKIRGYRVELGEIEAVLGQHPAVREVVVDAPETSAGERRLVAYLVAMGEPPTTSELHHFLKDRLPQTMIPAAFVFLPALPLSPNGKVDRRALPAPSQERPRLGAHYVAPRTPVEAALAGIWAEVIGVERVGVNDNFFELGGDSIRSVQVAAKAGDAGIELTIQQLFQHQTVAELAGAVEEPSASMPTPRTAPFALIDAADRARLPAGVEDAYPLAALQAGILFHAEYGEGTSIFHDVFSSHLRGPFSIAAFEAAIRRLIQRHPALRTGFALTGYREPLQLVYAQVEDEPLPYEDIRSLDAREQEAYIAAAIAAERGRPFDWHQPPLLRLQFHRRGDDSFQITVGFFHAILDGWSVATLMTELFQLYFVELGATSQMVKPPPTASYRDFVALERSTLATAAPRAFWRKRLQEPAVLQLPRWPRRAGEAGRHGLGIHHVPLDTGLAGALEAVARQAGVPLKSVLLAAHLKLLGVLANQQDILCGLVTNGRLEEHDGERVLGLFLNTMPLRVELTARSWLDLARATFRAEREALPYRRFPLAEIQRMTGGQPLFETMFNFMHFHVYEDLREFGGLELLGGEAFEQTNFTLVASFSLDAFSKHLRLTLDYDRSQLADEQVAAVAGYFTRVLAAIAETPEADHATCDVLSAAERARMLGDWNATDRPYRTDLCLHQLVEAQAERTPHAIAVVGTGQRLSYSELNRRANRLARHLRGLGVGPEGLVGICMERTPAMIVGLLAILKAGGAYVPLDPAYPAQRLAAILADAQPAAILTQRSVAAALPASTAQLIDLDSVWPSLDDGDGENLANLASPGSAAYVLYTSGSTGTPKGILIEHHSPVALVDWALAVFTGDELAGVLASTSLTFDLSVFEIFVPLSCGGKVILADNALALAELPAADEVTLVNTVPSAAVELLALRAIPPGVVTVNLAGEALRNQIVQGLYELGHVERVYNLYGPSEDTTYSTFHLVPRGAQHEPPIGRPIANTRAYILTTDMQPAPVGTPGELYLAGAGLARGYLNRPELTAERFVEVPARLRAALPHDDEYDRPARLYRTGDLARYLPDGAIEYLGRLDHQVKVRGYRIELGEIEAVLMQRPDVKEAVVVARSETPGDVRLVAYVVGATGGPLDQVALRDHLAQRLPAYMVPAAIVALARLPLTPNGKIDRRSLPAPEFGTGRRDTGNRAPRTPTEVTLATLWRQLLEVPDVGVDDDFFALGGHSLLATRLAATLRDTFQVNLPLARVFATPTVAALAAWIDAARASGQAAPVALPPCVLPIQPAGEGQPFFAFPPVAGGPHSYVVMAQAMGEAQPFYGLQVPGFETGYGLLTSIDELTRVFVDAIQAVQPVGPYALGGWSFGGMLAYAAACELRARGEQIALLALIEAGLPPAESAGTPRSLQEKLAAPVEMGRLLRKLERPASYAELRAMAQWIGIALPETWPDADHWGDRVRLSRQIWAELRRIERILRANAEAAASYVPHAYDGRVVLLRGAESGIPEQDPTFESLKSHAGHVDILVVPGNHMSIMLDRSHARSTGLWLRRCLEATVKAGTKFR